MQISAGYHHSCAITGGLRVKGREGYNFGELDVTAFKWCMKS